MKLLKPFVVPFGHVVTENGKKYQQGQLVPAGAVLTEVSEGVEPHLKGYVAKREKKDKSGGDSE